MPAPALQPVTDDTARHRALQVANATAQFCNEARWDYPAGLEARWAEVDWELRELQAFANAVTDVGGYQTTDAWSRQILAEVKAAESASWPVFQAPETIGEAIGTGASVAASGLLGGLSKSVPVQVPASLGAGALLLLLLGAVVLLRR